MLCSGELTFLEKVEKAVIRRGEDRRSLTDMESSFGMQVKLAYMRETAREKIN